MQKCNRIKDGNGSPFLEPTAFPWAAIQAKIKILPNAKDILIEINCRIRKTDLDSTNSASKPNPTWWDK